MKKWKLILWGISLLCSYGLFRVMEIGTAAPSVSFGNGNPFLLFLFVFWPVLFCFYYLIVDLSVRWFLKNGKKMNAMIAVCSLVAGTVVYIPVKINADQVRTALKNSSNAPYSEGWNQFTNSVYFNTYTFLLSFLVCIFLGSLISLILNFIKSKHE